MTWALEPLDPAAVVIPYLAAMMPDCTVGSRVEHRNRMITVQSAGGDRTGHVLDTSLVIVQAWAKTVSQASQDCRQAYTHLMSIRHDPIHGIPVRDVDTVALPGRFDDPDSGDPRFQTTVQISLRPQPMGVTP